MAHVSKWKNIPQKSYNLNKRNCVHFVEDALKLLGYKTNPKTKYRKKPTSFMKEIMKLLFVYNAKSGKLSVPSPYSRRNTIRMLCLCRFALREALPANRSPPLICASSP